MNIHVLQHVPFEGPGIISDWCQSHGHRLEITPLYSPAHGLPAADAVDMLIIMGGPMGVYDEGIPTERIHEGKAQTWSVDPA